MAPHEKPNAPAPAATGYAIVGTTAGAVTENPLLLRALRRAGGTSLDEHFFVTSALRCMPPRPPGDAEARRCRPFLQLEMRLLRPRVVLCFGALAARALLGREVRITEEHGRSQVVGESLVWTLVEPGARNGAALRRCGLTVRAYERWLGDLFASLLAPPGG